MVKYLSIDTTKSGTMLLPIFNETMVKLIDENTIYLGFGDFLFQCVNANQALVDSINNALSVAAELPSTKAVSKVGIPNKVRIVGPILER
jgi:hypothetical protein